MEETTPTTTTPPASETPPAIPVAAATPPKTETPPATTTPPAGTETPPASTPPAEIKVEDYAANAKIDEAYAKDVQIDKGAMDAVAPLLKEAGVTVEMANKLVNALAKYQIEQFKARQQERYDDNKKMHDAAIAKYSKADFEQINAGIDAAFKPDGVMNYIIRNSEIGNDPEFLALMRWYGEHKPTNTQPPAGAGTSGTTGQPAGFDGIASAWK